MYVEGDTADGQTDSGRPPVKVAGVDANGKVQTLLLGTDGSMTAVLTTGDIEIGAVEIKNATDDTRAVVTADNAVKIAGNKAEDAAAADGDLGLPILGQRNDNLAVRTGTDGDYSFIALSNYGGVYTIPSGNIPSGSGDSGNPLKVGGKYNTTAPAFTNGQRGDFQVDAGGRQLVSFGATTGTQSSVASSATSVTLLAANTARRGATITNDSAAILYLKLGATASTTSYTYKLVTDAYFEVPFGYTGVIDGIWASATGNARVTELT